MKRQIAMVLTALTVLSTTQICPVYAEGNLLISPNPTNTTKAETEQTTVAENKEPLKLTIEDAIKLTIENNQGYKDLDTSLVQLEESRKDASKAKKMFKEADDILDKVSFEQLMSSPELQRLDAMIMNDYVDTIRQKNGYYVKKCDIGIENVKNAKTQMKIGLELGTRSAYYNVLNSEKAIELNTTNLNKAKEQKRVADVKFANGLATRIEVLSADIAVQQAQTDLNNAEDELNIAKLSLLNTMGVPYDTEVVLIDKTLEYVPTNDLSLDDAIAKALADRAEIKSANDTLALQEMDTHAITSYYTSKKIEHKISEQMLESAKQDVIDVNRQIELDIRNQYLNLIKTERGLQNLDKSIELLKEALRVQQVLLNNGMASPVDVINAQADLTKAEIGRFELLTGYTLQKLSFENSNIISKSASAN